MDSVVMNSTVEKKSKTGFWGLLAKFGAKILTYLPKLLKMTKLIKVGLFAVSFASYAYLFTWKFALLLVIALGFHESSHVFAMKLKGIRTKGFYFLPFIGGVAIAEDKYKTYADNAFIALAGPIGGLALAIATYVAYLITGLPMLAAAAGWMAMLNLFNCFPLGMLDGGQVMKTIAMSISEKVGMICMSLSVVACIFVLFKFHIGLMGFVAGLGLLDLIGIYLNRKHSRTDMEDLENRNASFKAKWGQDLSFYEKYKAERIKKYKHPDIMNARQIVITIASYVLTVITLIVIMKLTAHIPGADIASNFMADK